MSEPVAAPRPDTPSPIVMRLAVGAAALLVVIAAGAFYLASQNARQPTTAGGIAVTVTSAGCEPNTLTAQAGRTEFTVLNRSDRALEWEILDGVMVVAERENIAPGLTATLSPRLEPGTYAVTCGLLSNPRGQLTVLPSGETTAKAPDLTAFIGPLAEMQVYLVTQGATFADAVAALQKAIASGDLAAARAAYTAATAAYARIQPAARRFADLGAAIEGTSAYLAGREADPAFTGLHRIEYGLFQQQSLAGLGPIAGKLVADTATLSQRLATRTPSPSLLAGDAVDWLAAQSQTLSAGGKEAYAGNDLADLSAGLEAVRKSIDLVSSLGSKVAAAEVAATDAAWSALDADLMAQKTTAKGFPDYRQLPADARQMLAADVAALGKALAALNDKVVASEVAS